MKASRLITVGLCALFVAFVMHCGGDDATCSKDGDPCSQGSVKGVCFSGSCTLNACVTDRNGTLSKRASGEINSDDGCQICDPSSDRAGWSKVSCPTVPSACRKANARCDATSLGGACRGEECCVYEPTWDGNGTAPECTYGAIKGTCDTQGRCTGVCKKNEDCVTGQPCRKFSCDVASESCSSTPDTGSVCDYVATGDGVCVAGVCQKQCTENGDCGPDGSCGPTGYCVAGRPNGSACTSNSQCNSANCECADSSCQSRVCAPPSTYSGARMSDADQGWRFAIGL
ncbi:MAG: hypothetical protein KC503_18945 [Myxococcales bacterium]|nr:hypothetical protein [Myxococcales bacterium]